MKSYMKMKLSFLYIRPPHWSTKQVKRKKIKRSKERFEANYANVEAQGLDICINRTRVPFVVCNGMRCI